jgi:hypothetical protein
MQIEGGMNMSSLPAKAAGDPDKPLVLSALAQGRWKVGLEESWAVEKPEIRKPDRKWYEEIICKKGGIIYLFSDLPPTLALFLNNRPHIAKQILREVPGTRLDLEMDKEVVIHFPPEALHQVCELAGGRKKRVLTEEQRVALIERGKSGREALLKYHAQRAQAQNLTQKEAIPTQARGFNGRRVRRRFFDSMSAVTCRHLPARAWALSRTT